MPEIRRVKPSDENYVKWLKGVLFCDSLRKGLLPLVMHCLRVVTAKIRDWFESKRVRKGFWLCLAPHAAVNDYFCVHEPKHCQQNDLRRLFVEYTTDSFKDKVVSRCGVIENSHPYFEINELEVAKVFIGEDYDVEFLTDLSQATLHQLLTFLTHCKVRQTATAEQLGDIAESLTVTTKLMKALHLSALTMTAPPPESSSKEAPAILTKFCDALDAFYGDDACFKGLITDLRSGLDKVQHVTYNGHVDSTKADEVTAYQYKLFHYDNQVKYWISSDIKEMIANKTSNEIRQRLLQLKRNMLADCDVYKELLVNETGVEVSGETKVTLAEQLRATRELVETITPLIQEDEKVLKVSMDEVTVQLRDSESKINFAVETKVSGLNIKVDELYQKTRTDRGRGEEYVRIQQIVEKGRNEHTQLHDMMKKIVHLDEQVADYQRQYDTMRKSLQAFLVNIHQRHAPGQEDNFVMNLCRQTTNIKDIIGVSHLFTNSDASTEMKMKSDSLPRRIDNMYRRIARVLHQKSDLFFRQHSDMLTPMGGMPLSQATSTNSAASDMPEGAAKPADTTENTGTV